ncbi:hypothetical protein HWV62_31658 [Athelia sp. TMB]|nr:hypothetical protein HWV62_31658 [Athelia sp. TMB]
MAEASPRKLRSRDYAHTLESATEGENESGASDSSPRKRITRAVGKGVDNLTRSFSGSTRPAPQSVTAGSPPPSARRLFSLKRKGKGRDTDDDSAAAYGSKSMYTVSDAPNAGDDSPFIRPRSPSAAPGQSGRVSLEPFRGDGSMRAGTQTLIQALQAIPWADDPDNDDEPVETLHHDLNMPADMDSEEEEDSLGPLASSLHTIHRPLARSRRPDIPTLNIRLQQVDSDPEESSANNDVETGDFERTPKPAHSIPDAIKAVASMAPPGQSGAARRMTMNRSGSMATVRMQRRARLAEKLQDVFELKDITEVRAELPCWLLRSDQILKSGTMSKKAQRTKRWIKHWFILKNDALSWYQSSSDPYFPHGIVDLRYAISCEPHSEKGIRLRTNQKTITLSADSVPSREEWLKAIRRVIFKAQNMGDSVKIAIPYAAVLDVEKSSAMDFSETIEVKVLEQEEQHSIDSYFFAYFQDLSEALDQIRDAVRSNRSLPPMSAPAIVLDTTASRPPPVSEPIDRTRSLPTAEPAKASGGFRLTSFLRPFQDSSRTTTLPAPDRPDHNEDFTHISKRTSSSFVPLTTCPKPIEEQLPSSEMQTAQPVEASASSLTPTPSVLEHTYPPSTPTNELPPSTSSSWNVGMPGWLKGSSRRVLGTTGTSSTSYPSPLTTSSSIGVVSEVYSPKMTSSMDSTTSGGEFGELAYSVLETPETAVDHEAIEKFRAAFAFDEKETLLGCYIYSLLPIYGRLYVSTNYFCFKSSGPLTTRTRMVLPIRDLLALEKTKATRFGHHGLIVIIKGYEELFFEFAQLDRRLAFITLLERQMEIARHAVDTPALSQGKRDALLLEEFEANTPNSKDSDARPAAPESMSESMPAVMFTSSSSTFLTFKPKESLQFTFLTIGSRGDVQPYIALAKPLMADGHRVKIATHGEFKEWIEAHGIEYGYVGGDPAELMRICIENGTFTLSFMKEGLLKFRGWIDDLLATSWEACQGSDVLIESPSAMGGYHIAEALGIPYFRAFTMTWSRTRWVEATTICTSLDKMEPHKIPFLYNFSPIIVPPPLDWPEWIRVTGYWFLDDAEVGSKKWTPPPDLEAFIDNAHALGKKVVYIGFGSIVVSDPKTMTRSVIEAVVQSGVHAILAKGWSDRLQAKHSGESAEPDDPLPKQIFPINSIPHDWLFRRIDAACHHGGAGTTGASLRAGIPTIIKPFFGDQFFWADRVEALGIGSGVRKLTVETLTEALRAATTDIKQIERARLVGEHIRAENGTSTAVEAIYRDLEYARSLVKQRTMQNALSEAVGDEDEDTTIRDSERPSSSQSGYSSSTSGHRASSEDWSVISDQDDRRSSLASHRPRSDSNNERPLSPKRNSLAAAVMSVIPDALHSSPSQNRP